MNTGERMTAILEDLGISRNAFAGKIGVTASAINGIVGNAHNPGSKVIMGLKKQYPKYNIEWLMTGKGEMKNPEIFDQVLPEQPSKNYLQDYLEKLENQFERLLSQLEAKDAQLESKDRQIDRLMDMLGKSDLSEKMPWGLERQMYLEPAA